MFAHADFLTPKLLSHSAAKKLAPRPLPRSSNIFAVPVLSSAYGELHRDSLALKLLGLKSTISLTRPRLRLPVMPNGKHRNRRMRLHTINIQVRRRRGFPKASFFAEGKNCLSDGSPLRRHFLKYNVEDYPPCDRRAMAMRSSVGGWSKKKNLMTG